MRSKLLGSICAVVLIGLASCTSTEAQVDPDVADIETRVEIDRAENVAEYKTYAWAAAAALVRDPKGAWTPSGLDVGSEIMSLVDRELRAKGRAQVVENPDMIAVFAVGVDMKAQDIQIDQEDGSKNFETVPRGGVMIALADTETRRVIWAGRAVGKITDKPSVELAQKRLDHGIKELFAKFPR